MNKMNVTQQFKFVLERDQVENILGKGENAGYQHFLLFPKCFQKPPSLQSLKIRTVWYRNKHVFHVDLDRIFIFSTC